MQGWRYHRLRLAGHERPSGVRPGFRGSGFEEVERKDNVNSKLIHM